MKCDEGEGSVRSCDQQVDGLVVEHLEDPFGWTGQAMIDSGNEIEQEQGKPIDAEADDPANVAIQCGKGDEYRSTGQRENCADEVADAIEPLPFVHARYSTDYVIVSLGFRIRL